jgi:hypothetical protein
MPFRVQRTERAPDWPRSLHEACDRIEAAGAMLANAETADEFDLANATFRAAHKVFRREMLALDKRRRPEMYR